MADFGILTLATPGDYPKAIGLALSLRVSNPGVPIAVACSAAVGARLRPYFDHIIAERPDVRGFRHKVHLDDYSPFRRTFFLDSDVLVFRPLLPQVAAWGDPPYAVCGHFVAGGASVFGFDRTRFLQQVGKPQLVCIDGAGHAYFRKPDCTAVFALAREITANYTVHAGTARYADEDAMAMAMTLLDLPPMPYRDFMARYLSAVPGTLQLDAGQGQCAFVRADNGEAQSPCMMHFAANEAPLAYTGHLLRLFLGAGVPVAPVLAMCAADLWAVHVKWPLARLKRHWLAQQVGGIGRTGHAGR